MKNDSYKEVPKMFSNDAVEFPKDLKVMMVDDAGKSEKVTGKELSKNVMYNVKGNKMKDY